MRSDLLIGFVFGIGIAVLSVSIVGYVVTIQVYSDIYSRVLKEYADVEHFSPFMDTFPPWRVKGLMAMGMIFAVLLLIAITFYFLKGKTKIPNKLRM